MSRARQLVWFYVRPTLHAALAERAEGRGHPLEQEILDILERAACPRPSRLPKRRGHLRVVSGADELPDAS